MKANGYHKGQIIEVMVSLDSAVTENWSGREDLFREKTSIARLAKEAGMSERNLLLLFKAYTGESPGAYKNRLRMEYAQQLMKDRGRTFAEISERTGFANVPAFNNGFRKACGMPPSAKRRELYGRLRRSETVPHYRRENLAATPILYLTFTGSYARCSTASFERDSWERLEAFAKDRGLYSEASEYWGIAPDDTEITREDKCRFYAALSFRGDLPQLGIGCEIKTRLLPEGQYAVYTHRGSYDCMEDFYTDILLHLDYEMGDTPVLEKYLNAPSDTPEEELLTEIWIPMQERP